MNANPPHPTPARILNALEQHFCVTGTDKRTVDRLVNILQANGIISDNVLAIEDIALVDAMNALQWLQSNGYLK